MSLAEKRNDLALALFDRGVVQLGEFKLKLHETEPTAPLSPIYFNLRTPSNPKPGPLTPELLIQIGMVMADMITKHQIHYSWLVGIPYAGDPIAEAVQQALLLHHAEMPIIKLQKETTGTGRRIVVPSDLQPTGTDKEVLVLDDLITGADSKLETIWPLRQRGFYVGDVAVLLDREQGGAQQLAAADCRLHSVFTLSKLLQYYLETSKIDKKQYRKVRDYLGLNTS